MRTFWLRFVGAFLFFLLIPPLVFQLLPMRFAGDFKLTAQLIGVLFIVLILLLEYKRRSALQERRLRFYDSQLKNLTSAFQAVCGVRNDLINAQIEMSAAIDVLRKAASQIYGLKIEIHVHRQVQNEKLFFFGQDFPRQETVTTIIELENYLTNLIQNINKPAEERTKLTEFLLPAAENEENTPFEKEFRAKYLDVKKALHALVV